MAKLEQDEEISNQNAKRKVAQKGAVVIDTPGTITNTIGTGENAKDSIAYLTIRFAFLVGLLLTAFVVANKWLFKDFKSSLIEDIKSSWQIVIPIITLVLGYYFGKSSSKSVR